MPIFPSERPASADLLAIVTPITPEVPDHELIRIIGRGSYGTVWLARNIMGTYRAIKVVHRASFDDDRPYDREFRGIQKFEPVSRSDESQVDILHIGKNEAQGYFYYVMELADHARCGPPCWGEHPRISDRRFHVTSSNVAEPSCSRWGDPSFEPL